MASTPTVPFLMPKVSQIPGILAPTPRGFFKSQAAAFKQGDFVKLVTTGTATFPAPTGGLATSAGPAASAVTISYTTSAGAPQQTYYILVTYTATGQESQESQEFNIQVPAGNVPTVSVASAGAPAAATNFAAYIGLLPGQELLQQASKTTTALGATFTAANPLTNFVGINQCATNDNANIVGIALHGSNAIWAPQAGPVGNNASLLGGWANPAPLNSIEPAKVMVAQLLVGTPFEISVKQPWYDGMAGTTFGLTLDSTSGYFVADNSQSNKVITVEAPLAFISMGLAGSQAPGVPNRAVPGTVGMRVKAYFNAGVI